MDVLMLPNAKPEITLCKWSRLNLGMQSRSVPVVLELRHYYLWAVGSSPAQLTAHKLCKAKPTIIIWQHDSLNKSEMLFCLLTCLTTNCKFWISMHWAKACATFGWSQLLETTLHLMYSVVLCFATILMEICSDLLTRGWTKTLNRHMHKIR